MLKMRKLALRVYTVGKASQQEEFLSRDILIAAQVSVPPTPHEAHRSQIFLNNPNFKYSRV